MELLAIIPLGFAPGLFWLWLIAHRDRYLPSPASIVIRTFLWGVVGVVPIALVEGALTFSGFFDPEEPQASPWMVAYAAFVVAGMVEEIGKFLVVRRTVYTSPYFLEPLDGLIFSAAAALGFASLENVFYMLSFGWQVILIRAPVSTLAHVVFGASWGYALGLEKMRGRRRGLTPAALGAGMLLHGLFDYLLLSDQGTGMVSLLALGLFLAGAAVWLWLLSRAVRITASRHRIVGVTLACPRCATRVGAAARFCPSCGLSLTTGPVRAAAVCGACGFGLAPHYAYCPSCGSRLDPKALGPWELSKARDLSEGSTIGLPADRPVSS